MKNSIAHLHAVCLDWTRELKFYKTEIPFFKKRLEEIVSKNTADDILRQVEHFENKFKIMNLHYDELLHDLKLMDESLLNEAAHKPSYISIKMKEDDTNLEELMEFTAADFNQTKMEFYTFLAKYL